MARVTTDEAVATLEEGHGRVRDLLSGHTTEELSQPATIGGGDWSAKDLVGHLAWWEELAIATLTEWRLGRRPWVENVFEDLPGGIDRINAEDQARKAGRTWKEVLALSDGVHRALVSELRAVSEEEWNAKAFYETDRDTRLGVLLSRVLGAPKRPFGHAFAHIPDLEAYVTSLR
jgi:hypothetical protein